jgi:hypothetical protein
VAEHLGQKLRRYAEKDGRGYPDWAVRYVPLVRKLRHRGKCRGHILEVGANENGFARFAGVRTVVSDISMEHLRAARATQDVLPVVADIAALPFRAGTFDLCICMDTFEHLPDAVRGTAAGQIVAGVKPEGVAVIAFPAGECAARAEQAIQRAYVALTGQPLHWLEEHAAQRLPRPEQVRTQLEAAAGAGRRVILSKNANLRLWQGMWFILMCGWPGRGNAIFQVLLRWATPLLCRMHFGTCYRTVMWVEPK